MQNKAFMTALAAALIAVAAYNIHFFFFKDREAAALTEAEQAHAGFPDMNDAMTDDAEDTMRDEAGGVPDDDAGGTPARPPVKRVSISQLSGERTPVMLAKGDRDPFSVRRNTGRTAVGPAKKTRPDTGISPERVKMIYIDNETAFAWIDGRRWERGETIGDERLLAIHENAILLESGGKIREVLIASGRAPEKGVQIDYGK